MSVSMISSRIRIAMSSMPALALVSALFLASPAAAVQFGRCDVQVGSSLVGIASIGVDDAGRPVLLVRQTAELSRVLRVTIDPPSLVRACDSGISVETVNINGFKPQAMAVGDLSGDGRVDLVLAGSDNVSGHDVAVFVGTGNGQFSPDAQLPYRRAQTNANSVVIGDVDRDGSTDLVVGSGASSSVTILYSGITASEPMAVEFGVSTGNLAVGFLNNDGLPDIATGSSGSGRLTAFYQESARTFRASASPSGVALRAFTLADLNGDLISDLLVTRESVSRLDLYLGPFASFADLTVPSVSLDTGEVPAAVASGDFTGRGIVDVTVANRDENSASLYAGDGLGGLQINTLIAGCQSTTTGQRCTTGTRPSAVVAADVDGGPLDLDGDGVGDIAVANEVGTLTLLLSGSQSTLPTASPSSSPTRSTTPSPSTTPTPTMSRTPTMNTTDCCEAHSSASCVPNRVGQESCSVCVCAQDAECCQGSWDGICADFARSTCADSCVCSGTQYSPTPLPSPTVTPTVTATATRTLDISPTPTQTSNGSFTPPATRTPSATVTGTPPTATRTPSRTLTPTDTPTVTPTSTVQACVGGLCINGEGCNATAGDGSGTVLLMSLIPVLLLRARRSH